MSFSFIWQLEMCQKFQSGIYVKLFFAISHLIYCQINVFLAEFLWNCNYIWGMSRLIPSACAVWIFPQILCSPFPRALFVGDFLKPVRLGEGNSLLSPNEKLKQYNLTLFTKEILNFPMPPTIMAILSRQNASFCFEKNIGWRSGPNPAAFSPFAKNSMT